MVDRVGVEHDRILVSGEGDSGDYWCVYIDSVFHTKEEALEAAKRYVEIMYKKMMNATEEA